MKTSLPFMLCLIIETILAEIVDIQEKEVMFYRKFILYQHFSVLCTDG